MIRAGLIGFGLAGRYFHAPLILSAGIRLRAIATSRDGEVRALHADTLVVPSPDALRLAVPKAYVVLAGGWEPTEETARAIFAHCREHMSPFARIRRIEFAELPKTISGKIRRVELRDAEQEKHAAADADPPGEFRDF